MGKSTFQWLHIFMQNRTLPFAHSPPVSLPQSNLKGIVKECGFFAPCLVEMGKRGRGKPQSTREFSRHRELHFK